MFDTFDCYINNERILFSSSKAKELFALLLVYRERGLTMYDAISQLWPDHDLEKSKKLYRDAVWRLHKTLKEIDFECVVSNRGELSLISKNIDCDYWNFLDGKDLTVFKGEFLKSYDWNIYYLSHLEEIQQTRK